MRGFDLVYYFAQVPVLQAIRDAQHKAWMCESSPSISSKKMILGCAALASSNNILNCLSASPTHFDKTSAPLRIKNAIFVFPVLHDAANARASSVLPGSYQLTIALSECGAGTYPFLVDRGIGHREVG